MPLGPLMLDLEGFSLTQEEVDLLKHPLVGGVIYFSRNYQSRDQINDLSRSIRAIRPELLISVDQEGGRVQRFKEGFTRLPAMQQFLASYQKDKAVTLSLVKDSAWLMAVELASVGVDFSFAPVLDLDDSHCQVIADRSFSPDPDEATALAGAWIAGMKEAGMASTGKHFPGHGGVIDDSHLALPVDHRSFSEIAKKDLLPFVALMARLDAIMPAHILFSEIDPEHTVGFSAHWLQTILRRDLGFKGVIFSDDLTMEGAASAGTFTDRARVALAAGCDMILVCNHRQGVVEVLDNLQCSFNPESIARLNKMRLNSESYVVDFHEEKRWQLTRKSLSTLV